MSLQQTGQRGGLVQLARSGHGTIEGAMTAGLKAYPT